MVSFPLPFLPLWSRRWWLLVPISVHGHTSPRLKDPDHDGTHDGDEDADHDGASNRECRTATTKATTTKTRAITTTTATTTALPAANRILRHGAALGRALFLTR
jgi:hypothetical protein